MKDADRAWLAAQERDVSDTYRDMELRIYAAVIAQKAHSLADRDVTISMQDMQFFCEDAESVVRAWRACAIVRYGTQIAKKMLK